jgi:hypothetical protein
MEQQFVMPVMFAQALGEYGALSSLATALESLVYRTEAIVGADGPSMVVVVGIAVVAWWLFVRRR